MAATAPDRILIAEDDAKTAKLLAVYLAREGFLPETCADGRAALERFEADPPGLLILDVMLPLIDGWEVCRRVRRTSDAPILFLTARDDLTDRLLGLGLGGDDYVVKPFSPKEVVARVKSILRRATGARRDPARRLTHGPLALDLTLRRATLSGQAVSLTPLEYALLATLMGSPGRVFLRDELIARLYPRGERVVARVVDVHVGKLRQKVERDPTDPRMILTVRGLGYRFADSLPPTSEGAPE